MATSGNGGFSLDSFNKGFGKSSDGATSKSSATFPTIQKPAGSNTNKWDATVLPNIEKFGLSETLDYENTKVIRNAYNNQHWKGMQELKKAGNIEAYEQLKKLHNSSAAFGNEMKKENPNFRLLQRYLADADEASNKAASIINVPGGAFQFDNRTGKILKQEEYRKSSQEAVVYQDKSSTDARVKTGISFLKALTHPFDLGNAVEVNLVDEFPKYKRLHSDEKQHMTRLRVHTNSYVSQWVTQALANANGSIPDKADFNNNALTLGKDVLSFIQKYGTTVNSELTASDKNKAKRFLTDLKGLEYGEQVSYLKKHRTEIQDMTKRMGYYGSSHMFNKYKKVVGDKDAYYTTGNDDRYDYMKGIANIEDMQATYEQFGNVVQRTKLKALSTAKQKGTIGNEYFKNSGVKNLDYALDKLVDEKGNIVSYSKFRSNLHLNLEYEGGSAVHLNEKGQVRVIYKDHGGGRLGLNYSRYEKGANPLGDNLDKEERYSDQLKNVYYNLVKGYKKTLDEQKDRHVYENSLSLIGSSANSYKAVGFDSVNMKTNKYGSLESYTSPKQQNLSSLWNLMRNEDGTFGKPESVVITRAASGNTVTLDDLKKLSKGSNNTMKEFLKSDPSDVQMIFFKETNVPGYSRYQFINNKTNQTISTFVKKSLLGNEGIKEQLSLRSYVSPEEKLFYLTGQVKLATRLDNNGNAVIKNPTIIFNQKTGTYDLRFDAYDDNGNYKATTIKGSYGTSLNNQKSYYNRILNEYVSKNHAG